MESKNMMVMLQAEKGKKNKINNDHIVCGAQMSSPSIPLLTPYKMGKFNLSHRYVYTLLDSTKLLTQTNPNAIIFDLD